MAQTGCAKCAFISKPACEGVPDCIGINWLTQANFIIHRLTN